MTRAEIEASYRVVNGIIVSPGPYALLPVYAPHYVELGSNGSSDRIEAEHDGPTFVFEIDASDVEHWPELSTVKTLRLWFGSDGFVFVGRELRP